jgi:hypothetical protein
MAQTAHAQQPVVNAGTFGEEFVQQKDGTFAWRNPVTGEIRPAQRQKEWDKLFSLMEEHGPADPGFLEGIEDPPLTYEETF